MNSTGFSTRLISMLLAVIMVFSMMPVSAFAEETAEGGTQEIPAAQESPAQESPAQGTDNQESDNQESDNQESDNQDSTDQDTEEEIPLPKMSTVQAPGYELQISVNGSAFQTATSSVQVPYYSTISLKVESVGGAEALTGVTFGYLSAAKTPSPTANWLPLLSGTSTLTPGGYYLCWEGQSATSGTVNDKTGAFQITSVKANLTAPTGLAWQTASPYKNTTATWNWTPKDTAETALTTFSVELKKDGATVSTKTVSAAVGTTAYTCDFGDYLAASADKAGTYTFSVTAVAADSELYNSAAAVTSIDTYLIVKLTPTAGEGIASVSPSTPFALIPGGSASADITATPNSDVEFRTWSSADGTVISNYSSATANISLSTSYSGSTDIAFTACGTDSTLPVISSFGGTSGGTTLTASVSDAGTGIKEYVFTKSSTAPTSGWTACTNKTAGAVVSAVSDTLNEGGQYYFFARDNSTTSTNIESSGPVQTTKVIYNLGYGGITENHYIIGSGGLTPATPKRSGYQFTGWYIGNNEIKTLSAADYNKGTDVTITAHWVVEPVSFNTNLKSTYEAIYSDSGVNLSVELNITGGSVTYTWYKGTNAVKTETTSSKTSTYNVKNVADSGKYKVVAVVDVDGTKTTVTSNIADVQISKANVTVEVLSHVAKDYGTDPADITDDIVENKNYKYTLNGADVTSSIECEPVFKYTSGSGDYDEIGDPAGTYTIAVDSESTTSDNYSFSASIVQKQLTVNKIPLTISGITASKQYDGTTAADKISIANASGLIQYDIDNSKKDTITISGTYASKNAGDSIPLTGVALVPGDYISARYNVSCDAEELPTEGSITRRDITVTADNASKNYRAADPKTFTYQITSGSLVSGESLAGALSRDSNESVGKYDITQGTLDNTSNPNYNITYVKGIFEILPNSGANKITLSGTIDKTYDGIPVSDPTYSCESDYSGTCEIEWYGSDASQELSSKPSNAGTYYFKILAPEDGKYAACESALTQFTISKKEITVTPTANQFSVYNPDSSTDPTLTYTNTALCGSDTLTGALSRVQAGESWTAGRYKITIGTLRAVDGEGNDSSNYTITLADEYYTITKATVTAPMPVITTTDWYYGDNERAVTFGDFDHPEDVRPTAHYVRIENSSEVSGSETTTQPKNAGTYRVWAEVSESTNYSAASGRSNYIEFTISPRPVTVTAASKTWEYDATEHTFAEYSCSYTGNTAKAAFPGNEGIASVVFDAASKITGVGTQANTITSVNFKYNTSASNYSITLDPGELKVTAAKLATPTLSGWEITTPGTAVWVAVANASSYKVLLFKDGADTAYKEYTVPNTSYDFSSDIKDVGTKAAYTYTVQAIGNSNYSDSTASGSSPALNTAKITLNNINCTATIDSTIILPYEKLNVSATPDTGYVLSNTAVWSSNNAALSAENAKSGTTKVTLSALSAPADITLTASCDPAPATIESFTAANNTDKNYANVLFSFSATHDVNITEWALSTATKATDVSNWNTVSTPATEISISDAEISVTGAYYLYVKAENNSVAKSDSPINVYSIDFDKGDANGDETMSTIYKAQSAQLNLPANTFTYAGMEFSNWWVRDTGNTYADKGSFNENSNVTLTAQWVIKKCTYTVEYWVQKADKNDDDFVKESEATFKAAYGTVVTTQDEEIQKPDTGSGKGLILDDSSAHTSQIELKNDSQIIQIYYKREIYNINYTHTDGDQTVTDGSTSYKYGQTIELSEIMPAPVKAGYTFIGWMFDNSRTVPDKMPARNISATGYFVTGQATFTIYYYTENLDKQGYTEEVHYTYISQIDSTQTVSTSNSPDIEGFEAFSVAVNNGEPVTTPPEGDPQQQSWTLKSDQNVNFSVFYKRKTFNLTLKIYKDTDTATGRSEDTVAWSRTYKIPYKTNFNDPEFASTYVTGWKNDVEGSPKYIPDDGYTVTEFAHSDWTSGWIWPNPDPLDNPYEMLATDVEISLDCYLKDSTPPLYNVEIYLETGNYDEYQLAYSTVYYTKYGIDGEAGTTVTIGDPNDGTGNKYTVDYFDSEFTTLINDYDRSLYVFSNGTNTHNNLSGTITYENYHKPTPETVTLKVYLKRARVSSTISYYYYDPGKQENILFATAKKSVAWSHSYNLELTALFSSTKPSATNPYESVIEHGSGGDDKTPQWSDFKYETATGISITPQTYDFKANNCVITYNAYGHTWSTGEYSVYKHQEKLTDETAIDDLSVYSVKMSQKNNSVQVYYRPTSIEDNFFYDIYYKSNYKYGLKNPDTSPLIVNIEGVNYQVRLVNKNYVYANSGITVPTGYTNYPGAAYLDGNATYNYTGGAKSGFAQVTYEGKTYYTKEENNVKYLYVTNDSDSFRRYNNPKYSYHSASNPGYSIMQSELTSYKGQFPQEQNIAIDSTPYIDYNLDYKDEDGTGTHGIITLYLRYSGSTVYRKLYHTIDGKVCGGHEFLNSAKIDSSTTVKDSQGNDVYILDKCTEQDTKFTGYDGYNLVWYYNLNGTLVRATQVSGGITMSSNRTLVGRLEKQTMYNMDYAYYEILEGKEIGGVTYTYITEESIKDSTVLSALNVDTDEVDIGFINGAGGEEEKTVVIKKYYLKKEDGSNGQLVLVSRSHPALSYQELAIDWASDTTAKHSAENFTRGYFDAFATTMKYEYDDSNKGNISYCYCGSTPIVFRAYYSPQSFKLNIRNASGLNETEERIAQVGESETINAPGIRIGYKFSGWDWSDKEETWPTGLDNNEPVNIAITMPGHNLTATATWSNANYPQTIYHYFQNTSGSYNSALLDKFMAASGEDAIVNGKSGKIYKTAGTIEGASYTDDNGLTYYYDATGVGFSAEGTTVTAGESELIAVVQTASLLNNTEYAINDYAVLTSVYTLTSVDITKEDGESSTVSARGKFTSSEEIDSVKYFYSRPQYEVSVAAKATDNGETGSTISGAGTFYYGLEDTISITFKESDAYTFKGWYYKADVLTETDDDGKLKNGWETRISPVTGFTDSEKTFVVDQDYDLIAVVEPEGIERPESLTIAGKHEYTYGYQDEANNTVYVTCTVPEGVYISAYQWYAVNGSTKEEISGQTSATYHFPTGKNTGTYSYQCGVTFTKNSNGRSMTFDASTSAFDVVVNPAAIQHSSTGYSGEYDGTAHGGSVSVTVPESGCTLSYKEDGDNKQWTANAPEYINAGTYKVYYKVTDTTGNYNSTDGSDYYTITITQKLLTLSATGNRLSRTYVSGNSSADDDQITAINSNTYEQTTKYYYKINGLIGTDSCTITFNNDTGNAVYNSSHVAGASEIVFSNIALSGNGNYRLPDGYTLTVPAVITPIAINNGWYPDPASFEYDGAAHAPSVTFPTEYSGFTATVTGSHIDAGTYTAEAELASVTGTEDQVSDYYLTDSNKDYTITPAQRSSEIHAVPHNFEDVYDGTAHYATVTAKGINGSELSASDYTVYYDTSAFAAAESYTGKSTSPISYTNAGENTVYYYIKDNTGNYSDVYGDACTLTVKITKRPVTITGVAANDKLYDGTVTASFDMTNAAISNIADSEKGNAERLSIKQGTAAFNDATVGKDKTVTFTDFSLEGTAKDNYTVSGPAADTADINTAEFEVTFSPDSHVYDKTAYTFTPNPTATVKGGTAEVQDVSYTYRADKSSAYGTMPAFTNAGTHTVYYKAEKEGYNTVEGEFNVTITPATLTVTWDYTSPFTYDTTMKRVSASLNGVIEGDTVSIVMSGITNATKAGTYSAVADEIIGASASNYTLTSSTLPWEIDRKNLDDTAHIILGDVGSFTYDKTAHTPVPSVVLKNDSGDIVAILKSGVDFEYSYENNVNASTTAPAVVITAKDGTNYTGSRKITFTINPAEAYVTWTLDGNAATSVKLSSSDKGQKCYEVANDSGNAYVTYDGDPHSVSAVVQGLLTGDSAEPTYSTDSKLTETNSGAYYSTTGSKTYAATVTGTSNTNYVLVDSVSVTTKNADDEDVTTTTSYPLTLNWAILRKAYYNTNWSSPTEFYYDAQQHSVSVSVNDGYLVDKDKNLLEVRKDSSSTFAATEVGNYTAKVLCNNDDSGNCLFTISGTDPIHRNYFTMQLDKNWKIKPSELTVTGVSSSDKVYDGNDTATITGTPVLSGEIVSGDSGKVTLVSTGAKATFNGINAGSHTVSFSGYTLSGDAAGHYTLKQPASVTNSITKRDVYICDVGAENKVYDAGTSATGTVTYQKLYTSADGSTEDTVAASDISSGKLTVNAGTGTFADKNVGTGKTVTLDKSSFTISGTASGNYTLNYPDTFTATAAITPKSVDCTWDYKTAFTFDGTDHTVTPAITGVLNGEDVTFSVTGNTKHDVGTYTAQIGTTLQGTGAGNYKFKDGFVYSLSWEIKPTKLATPTVTWDSTIGTVSWTEVNGIGTGKAYPVAVKEYMLELFKDGQTDAIKTETVSAADAATEGYKHDFAYDIRTAGAGKYTVKVTAIVDTTNNENKVNVADSSAGTSAVLRAANISFIFNATDEDTQAGKAVDAQSKDKIYINNAASVCLIEGEQANLVAILKNATGYAVKSCAADHSGAVTIRKGSLSSTDYSNTVTLKTGTAVTDAAISGGITVTLTLKANEVEVAGVIDGKPTNHLVYGYLENATPTLSLHLTDKTGTAFTKNSDGTFTYEGVTYNVSDFTWTYRTGYTSTQVGNESSYKLPYFVGTYGNFTQLGLAAAAENVYFWNVTATVIRTDNGKTAVLNSDLNADNLDVPWVNIAVDRATVDAESMVNDGTTLKSGTETATWVYGSTGQSYTVNFNPGNAPADKIKLYWQEDSSNPWSTEKTVSGGTEGLPTEENEIAGMYYHVRVYVPKTDNYNEIITTNDLKIQITQAQLAAPTNLEMVETKDHSPIGTAQWKPVNGIGSVAVEKYEVRLYKGDGTPVKIPDGEGKKDAVYYADQPATISDDTVVSVSMYDAVKDLEPGSYYFTVKSIASTANNSEKHNVDDSKPAKSSSFVIGNITGVSKKYDGSTYSINAPSTTGSYEWYKDGVKITETSGTVNVADTTDSGEYVCKMTNTGGNVSYTNTAVVNITKRSVTLTSDGDEKTYDGTALTKNEQENVKISGDGFVSGEGATYDITGSRFITGTSDNEFTYTLNSNTDSDNYDIKKVFGELKVNAIATKITITADSYSKVYDSTALTDSGYTYTNNVILDGDTLTAVTEGTITDVGSEDNKIKSYKVTHDSTDVTSCYSFETPVNGTLTVNARPITITTDNYETMYNGNAQGDAYSSGHHHVKDGTSLGTGDSITDLSYDTHTDADTSYKNSITSGSLVIKNSRSGDKNLVGNYTVTYEYGDAVISPRDVTITSKSDSREYNGEALTKHDVEVTGDGFVSGEGATYTYTGTQTFVGSSDNTFNYSLTDKTKISNYNIKTANGTLTVSKNTNPITITANSNTKMYDGSALTDSGYTKTDGIIASTDTLTAVVEGTITDYGTEDNVVTSYQVMHGDKDVTDHYTFADCVDGTLEITKRNVTMTSATDSKVYDGKPLTNDTVTETGDGFIAGEGATYSVTGSQTYKGESDNTFSYTLNDGTKADNYSITQVKGKLTVNPKPLSIKWPLDTKYAYNGDEIKIEPSLDDVLDADKNYVSLVHDDESAFARTDAGWYTAEIIGLSGDRASNYKLKNEELKFEWEIGPLKFIDGIGQSWAKNSGKDAVFKTNGYCTQFSKLYYRETGEGEYIEITNSLDSPYYEVEAGSTVITLRKEFLENLVTGTTYDLKAEYNPGRTLDNPDDAVCETTFSVTSTNATVTIKGKTSEVTYNGSEQSVEGYDATATGFLEDNKFDEKKIVFTGTKTAKGTNASDTPYTMGLKAEQFSYSDSSVSVTFEVVDGSLTIKKAAPSVTIKPKTVTYTGSKFKVDDAVITMKGTDKWSGTVTYYYYSDEACTNLVSTDDGVSAAGVYYVQAVATPDTTLSNNYTEGWSSKVTLYIKSTSSKSGTNGGNVTTGDEFSAYIWIAAMALSSAGAVTTLRKKKKEDD